MKKLIALLLVLVMAVSMAACVADGNDNTTTAPTTEPTTESTEPDDGVMTYAEFMAAELDTEVIIETYVQAHQSWWDNKITVYCQDEEGAYFLYEMACSEEDAAKLTAGTKIRVTGVKGAWEGEVEIMDGTFEIIESDTHYVAEPTVMEKLGEDDLLTYQNHLVLFNNMTIKDISYKNDEPGDDIYVTLTSGETELSFCVERYLTDPDTDLYKMFTEEQVKVGDTVNVGAFLYWYQGPNPHIVHVEKAG